MSYPRYPQGYQPYPQQAGTAPGGGTAIAAGVLACLGAIVQGLGGIGNIAIPFVISLGDVPGTLWRESWFTAYSVGLGIGEVVSAALLGVGAVSMFRRKQYGSRLVAAGCGVTIVGSIAGYVTMYAINHNLSGVGFEVAGGTGAAVALLFPIVTMILALVPSTGSWLAYTPPQFGAYPAQPHPAQPFPPYPGQPIPGRPAVGAQFAPNDARMGPPSAVDPTIPQPPPYPQQPDPLAPQPSDPAAPPSEDPWRRPES